MVSTEILMLGTMAGLVSVAAGVMMDSMRRRIEQQARDLAELAARLDGVADLMQAQMDAQVVDFSNEIGRARESARSQIAALQQRQATMQDSAAHHAARVEWCHSEIGQIHRRLGDLEEAADQADILPHHLIARADAAAMLGVSDDYVRRVAAGERWRKTDDPRGPRGQSAVVYYREDVERTAAARGGSDA